MIYDDMNLSRLVVYAQSIEGYKLKRKSGEVKRSRPNAQRQPMVQKRDPNQDS